MRSCATLFRLVGADICATLKPWKSLDLNKHFSLSPVRVRRILEVQLKLSNPKETIMAWSKPEFTDMRFGFEVTMYIFNR
ncbi:MAG: pyrroloquinoline quinone precursor peptide PqqA [Burkholderiales bacterium]